MEGRIPTYRRHRKKGRKDEAFAEVGGRRVYLGQWGTEQARRAYARIVAGDLVLSKFLTDSQVPRVDRFVAAGDSCRRSFRCDFLDVGTLRSDYHRPTWEPFNLGSSSSSPSPVGSTAISRT